MDCIYLLKYISIKDILEHFIKVIFPFEEEMENGDENGDENKVLMILEKVPDITAREISDETGFSTRKISRIIKELRETGKITRVGSDRKGYWEINK